MTIHIHSVAGDTCLVDFDRDGFTRGEDPAGFTALMTLSTARALVKSEGRGCGCHTEEYEGSAQN